jgi:hypothetical protein
MYKVAHIKNHLRSQIPAHNEFAKFSRKIEKEIQHHADNILQLPGYMDDKSPLMTKWDFQPDIFHSDTFDNLTLGMEINLPAPQCLWLTIFIVKKAYKSTKLNLRHYQRAIRFDIGEIADAIVATTTIIYKMDHFLININEDYCTIAVSLLQPAVGYVRYVIDD